MVEKVLIELYTKHYGNENQKVRICLSFKTIKILPCGKVRKAYDNENQVEIKKDKVAEVEKLFVITQLCVYNSLWGKAQRPKLSILDFGLCPEDNKEPWKQVPEILINIH